MRRMKQWISLTLIVCLCLSLAGCFDISSYLPSTQESTEDGLTTYHVTVRTHSGQYLKDVGVRVFADTDKTDLVWYDKTDANGKMTFIADTFDGYVVTLENTPDGYVTADYYTLSGVDHEIVLSIGLQTNVDLNTVKLALGDPMVDMTVTAADGAEYNISKMLASKKAVALYFFDGGTTETLSCLEQAWNEYSDEVAVLALNPVDADVTPYVQNLSIPVAACDSGWTRALGMDVFPTLLVVDRYGVISLLHAGAVDNADVFRDVFAFFARNDYTAEVVPSLESITGKELQGTRENPYITDGGEDIMASVAPGSMVYYHIYKVQDMLLQIQSANAWVVYEGQEYYPENGVITIRIDTIDPFTPVLLGLGNAGTLTELFVARFSYPVGTAGNPCSVDLGQFTAALEAGDENGQFFMYKAIKPGTLRIRCAAQTQEVAWVYTITNRSTGIQRSSEEDIIADELTGETYMLLDVTANDVVIICVSTKPNKEGQYPEARFELYLGYEGAQGEDPQNPPLPGTETTYSVTVRDSYGFALKGVSVIFSDASGAVTVVTDETGTAAYTNRQGSVSVSIIPLQGYTIRKSEFSLNESTNNLSVTFTGKMEGEPTLLSVGNAYRVALGENYVIMDGGSLNYFLFTPTASGMYYFSGEGSLGFWGWDMNQITDHMGDVIQMENGFVLLVSDEKVGQSCIVSITGVPYTTLAVTWMEGL